MPSESSPQTTRHQSKKHRRTQGDGGFYKTSTGLWKASIELPAGLDGERRRAVVSSKDRNEAIRKLQKLRREVEEGHVPTKGRRPTVEKTFEIWLNSKGKLAPRTRQVYESLINAQIVPHIGNKQINIVKEPDIRRMMTAWQDAKLAGQSMKNAYNLLNPMFKWAMREGLRRGNPMERFEVPSATRNSPEPFSAADAMKLLRVAADEGDSFYERWAFQLLQGTRQGETLGLTKDALDLDNLTVDISWQLQWLKLKPDFEPGPGMDVYPVEAFVISAGHDCKPVWRSACLTRPKGRKSRLAPLLPELADALKTYLARTPLGAGGLVWSRPDGRPIRPADDNAAWKAALARAELPVRGTHANRHTTNTLLLQRGVPEDVRMQILGHSTATANKIYAHVDLTMAREAMSKLHGILPTTGKAEPKSAETA